MHQPSQETPAELWRRPANAGTRSAVRRNPRTRRSARLDGLAVAILAAMTVLLWVAAIPQTRDALIRFGADHAVGAQVTQCPTDRVLSPPCQVTFPKDGESVTRPLTHAGLFGVEPGEAVEVLPAPDGTVTLAGWRPVADSALLLLLALAFTSYTMRRWVRAAPLRRTGRSDRSLRDGRRVSRPRGHRRTGPGRSSGQPAA